MKEIRVSEINCIVYDFPLMQYACDGCGCKFIDSARNYKYCPYCGRKISGVVEDSRLYLENEKYE